MPITNHGAPHSLDHSTVFDMYLLCVCLSFLSLRIPAQNIADIVKTKHRHKVDVSDAAWSNDKIKNHLSELGCKKKLPCEVHEGCECPLLSTDLHRLTSPCQGHSDMNGCRQYNDDVRFRYFLLWCSLCLTCLFKAVWSENVDGFGVDIYHELLGHAYFIHLMVEDVAECGWKSSRKRQVVLLLSKVWLIGVFSEQNVERPIDITSAWVFNDFLMWDEFFSMLFHRTCEYSIAEYLIATEDIWTNN
jgi:site-specific DNA-cytosine methylase